MIADDHLTQIGHHPIRGSDIPRFQHELIQFRQVLWIELLFSAVLVIQKCELHDHLHKREGHLVGDQIEYFHVQFTFVSSCYIFVRIYLSSSTNLGLLIPLQTVCIEFLTLLTHEISLYGLELPIAATIQGTQTVLR